MNNDFNKNNETNQKLDFNIIAEETLSQNYTISELMDIVDKTRIDQLEILSDSSIETKDKVNLIYYTYKDELLFNKEVREKFIEKLSFENAKAIVDSITTNGKNIIDEGKYYSFLIAFSQKRLTDFLKVFGLSNHKQAIEEETIIQGIETVTPEFPLYNYQQKIANQVNQLIETAHEKSCMIHLPTGAGKTRTAMNIVCDFLRQKKSVVIWLTNRTELSAQALNTFKEAWSKLGNRPIKTYSFFGDSYLNTLDGITEGLVVASVGKVYRQIINNERVFSGFAEKADLIVFDEAHQITAPTYKTTVEFLMNNFKKDNTFLIGLSATPGRKLKIEEISEEDIELSSFFDKNKVTMKVSGYSSPITYLTDNNYLAVPIYKLINYEGSKIIEVEGCFSSGKNTEEVKELLAKDKQRNKQILEVIKKEFELGKSIIVFATNLAHASQLQSLLAIDKIKSFKVDGGDSKENRDFRVHQFKKGNVKILINYDVLTAGFDAPITSVAIIARPTDSLVAYSQMAGRAMRGKKSGGNDTCNIYTVRDDIPAYTNVIKQFEHWDEVWTEV